MQRAQDNTESRSENYSPSQQTKFATKTGEIAAAQLSAMKILNNYKNLIQAALVLLAQHDSSIRGASQQNNFLQNYLVDTIVLRTTPIESTFVERFSIDVLCLEQDKTEQMNRKQQQESLGFILTKT